MAQIGVTFIVACILVSRQFLSPAVAALAAGDDAMGSVSMPDSADENSTPPGS